MNDEIPEAEPESAVEKTANIQLLRCNSCGHIVEPESKFCSACGGPLADETHALPVVEDSDPLLSANDSVLVEVEDEGAVLVVRRGPHEGARFPLSGDQVTVGRSQDAVIFLDDVTVSRRHAELFRDEKLWCVVDNRSLNGTYVNRSRIDRHVLSHGDEVQIGKYRFVFYQVGL